MPNLTLLSILAVIMTAYFSCMWATKMISQRGDDILSGIIKGVPAPTKDRRLMLFTEWLPWVALQIALLVILCLSFLEMARGVEDPRVGLIGYMCAIMCAFAATFWSILGSVLFANMSSVLRKTTRT